MSIARFRLRYLARVIDLQSGRAILLSTTLSVRRSFGIVEKTFLELQAPNRHLHPVLEILAVPSLRQGI